MCSEKIIEERQYIMKIKSHIMSIVRYKVLHQSILGLLNVIR